MGGLLAGLVDLTFTGIIRGPFIVRAPVCLARDALLAAPESLISTQVHVTFTSVHGRPNPEA